MTRNIVLHCPACQSTRLAITGATASYIPPGEADVELECMACGHKTALRVEVDERQRTVLRWMEDGDAE